jgi:hypothetical protein
VVFQADGPPLGLQRGDALQLTDLVPGLTISIDELFDALNFK